MSLQASQLMAIMSVPDKVEALDYLAGPLGGLDLPPEDRKILSNLAKKAYGRYIASFPKPDDEVCTLLGTGKKVKAIKRYRKINECDLLIAKQVCEHLLERWSEKHS